MTVLVVDGSAAVRVRLGARLREAGLEVVAELGTVKAAVAHAGARPPDAIVVDPLLPDGSGPDVVTALMALAPLALFAVVTSDPDRRYRHRYRTLGVELFFDKSNEFDAIATAIAAAGELRTPIAE